jgi:hypothetical protein
VNAGLRQHDRALLGPKAARKQTGAVVIWAGGVCAVGEKFERHKQAWTSDEVQKLHTLAKKGMPLRSIAKALTRSEESVKARAKEDKLGIASLR